MADDNWQKVREIFDSALRRPLELRQKYISEACGGDKILLAEVESLLSSHDSAESFMETPAVAKVAEVIEAETKYLETGKCFGHYEIIKQIGAGGMGEVYLAKDKKLDRQVAVKILNEKFSRDESNLERFIREAKAASALNHPNILVIHEIGEADDAHFIVSEFIKGKTLRETFKKNTLEMSEILDVSIQIANALCTAHEARLVHRDIKPENIMIRPDGYVKILDFGLAKLVERKNKSFLGLDNETTQQTQTAKGMIMGTVNYMSPEQAKAESIDERTDIFSFGAVIYEMIAQKTPFAGDSMSETFANLINAEPSPLSRFNSNVPDELQRIVTKMLRKDKDARYQTMKGLLADLKDLRENLTLEEKLERSASPNAQATQVLQATTGDANLQTAETQNSFSQTIKQHKSLAAFAIVVLLVALAGVVGLWKTITQSRNQPTTNILASLRIKPLIIWDGEAGEGDVGARFSPNGAMIAYSLTKNGQTNIWTKQIPDGKPNPITDGKLNYFNPIWSPDGQRIAFVSNRDNQLAIWAMPFSGGELTPVKAMESNTRLLHWSKNGATIYYVSGFNLFALDIASKQITQLTNFDDRNQAQYFSISPSEDRIAYSSGPNERLQIFVMPIGGGSPVQVTTNDEGKDEYPFWLPDGNRIIYSSKRDGIFQTCIAYLNEHNSEQINLGISDTLISDVAPGGDKILFSQSREESDLWQVGIDDKSETQITSDSGLELWSDVSPDGKSVVFQATTESKHLLEGSLLIRSIDDKQQINIASNGFSPTFSPDGRQVAFLRDADNLINLWITGRNGADERQLTTEGIWFDGFSVVPYNRIQVKDYSWSPDGNSLIYCAKKDGNIWQVAADGANAPRQITNNTDKNVRFSCPLFAPDGKRIGYLSSVAKPSAGAKSTTNICLLNGENPEIIFSSESVFKLIGWEQFGNNLIIAMPEDKPTAKLTKVRLILISAGNNRTDLASIEAAYFDNIQLSPDRQKIAFATREDGKDNLRVISMVGDDNAKITASVDPNVYISGIAWSPDGKAIYYSKQKQVGTISMIENFK